MCTRLQTPSRWGLTIPRDTPRHPLGVAVARGYVYVADNEIPVLRHAARKTDWLSQPQGVHMSIGGHLRAPIVFAAALGALCFVEPSAAQTEETAGTGEAQKCQAPVY